MLAPRKKLWSTPPEVIEAAISMLPPLSSSSVVYDVGCGDGRVLIKLASDAPQGSRFIGIEIDETRAMEARANVASEGLTDRIMIQNENAMLLDYSDATHVFLYLVPRGLRIFKPVLLAGRGRSPLHVVTYMSGFKDEQALSEVKVAVEHQDGSGWPLFLYELRTDAIDADSIYGSGISRLAASAGWMLAAALAIRAARCGK